MKKIVILFFIILFAQFHSFGQDTKAVAILNAMSKRYQSLPFAAQFTYQVENKGMKEVQKGDITVKGKKYRLKLAGQEIFNNGQVVSTYIKETNEVNISDFEPNETGGSIDPAKIYTIYKKGYKYLFIEETKESGKVYEVVELTPENKASQVTKVRIKVDKADKSVKSWIITDKTGKKTTFRMDKFQANPAVSDSYFVFDKAKYPGVEVIDLR